MRQLLMRSLLVAFVAYSIAHFVGAGAAGLRTPASRRCGGDFESAFPSPPARRFNPALAAEFGTWTGSEGDKWNYGPIFHVVTAPLVLLPNRGAVCAVWLGANIIFALIAAVVLFGVVFGGGTVSLTVRALYACGWLNFYPLLEAFRQGNIEIFELLLLVVVYALLASPRPRQSTADSISGLLVGLATMTKFLPAIFLPYFFIKRRWQAFALAIAEIVVVGLLAQWALDWRKNWTWGHVDPVQGFDVSSHTQGLTSLVLRFFLVFPDGRAATPRGLLTPEAAHAAYWTVRASVIVAMFLFALVFLMRRRHNDVHLEISLLVAFMVFIPQWSNDYYQTFLVIPLAVLLRLALGVGVTARLAAGLLPLVYVGTASTIVPASWLEPMFALPPFGVHRLLQNYSIPAWTNLVLLACLAVLYVRSSPSDARPSLGAKCLASDASGDPIP